MVQNEHKSIPEASLRRLPLYHRFLETLRQNGREAVSCPEIGLELHLDPTQVRKDLEAAGITGRPRIGYRLVDLIAGIETFLGWDNAHDAFLVGVGSLGTALLGYSRFNRCGLTIVAGFDVDPAKLGTKVHEKEILPLNKLAELALRMHVHLGIITVPAPQAQMVADMMVSGGIRAIWNFAPLRLELPEHVIVHNEDLYCSLASLSQKLAQSLRRSAELASQMDVVMNTDDVKQL